jgi:hypothetical protein
MVRWGSSILKWFLVLCNYFVPMQVLEGFNSRLPVWESRGAGEDSHIARLGEGFMAPHVHTV